MRLSNIAFLCAVRLKSRAVLAQEIFAVIGIAVGVGLLFAAQIASTSLNGSVAAISSGIVGKATLQVEARSPQGFSQSMFARASRLAGVRAAVPVLEQQALLIGPRGRADVDLFASAPRYVHLAGPLLRHFSAAQARKPATAGTDLAGGQTDRCRRV